MVTEPGENGNKCFAESFELTGLVEISFCEAGEMEAPQQVINGKLMASISLIDMRGEGTY